MRRWLRPGESVAIAVRILDARADELDAAGSHDKPDPWTEADRHHAAARQLENQ